MAPSKQCITRLQKELVQLRKEPNESFNAAPDPKSILTWLFVFDGPADTPYAGGRYVGKVVFPPDYPFKAPDLFLHTPNGRFHVNAPICTTNTSFHPESWSPMWNVTTILTGFISLFASEEASSSSVTASPAHRRELARESIRFNLEHLAKTYAQALPEEFEKDKQLLDARARDGAGCKSGTAASSSPWSDPAAQSVEQKENHAVLSNRSARGVWALGNLLGLLLVLSALALGVLLSQRA